LYRYRKVAICSRVMGELGWKRPSALPLVIPVAAAHFTAFSQ
jgi:hypothetical protein